MALSIRVEQLAWVIIKATYNEEFRDRLIKHPDQALADEGFDLSQKEIQLLKDLNPEEWGDLSVNDLNARLSQVGVPDVAYMVTNMVTK